MTPTVVASTEDSRMVVTLAGEPDATDLAALSATVAAVVHDVDEILVDVSHVDVLPRAAVLLLTRLGAMARCAGGRLRVRFPAAARPAEVDVDPMRSARVTARVDTAGRTAEIAGRG